MIPRRQFLHLAGSTAAIAGFPRIAGSQTYPARPVRMIVPFAAGGPTDVIARLLGQKLSESLGQQFYIENIPTGASNVGTGVVAKAPPDGYTIAFVTSSFVINTSLYAKIPYDPVKDFAPIMLVATSPHALTVNPSLPASSVKELIALVKANPGKYSYASAGTGQSAQLAAELFKLAFGLDIVHVPFNGGAPAMASTIAGHTMIAFNALPAAAIFIKEGKVRALAVTSSTRAPEFPDVPTLTEAGVPDQVSDFITGIAVPAGTPKELVHLLHRELVRILALPDVRARVAAIGFNTAASSPEEFGALIKTEIARWAKVIHDANIKKVE